MEPLNELTRMYRMYTHTDAHAHGTRTDTRTNSLDHSSTSQLKSHGLKQNLKKILQNSRKISELTLIINKQNTNIENKFKIPRKI